MTTAPASRRTYRKPTLKSYGELAEITRMTVGMKGKADAQPPAMTKTGA